MSVAPQMISRANSVERRSKMRFPLLARFDYIFRPSAKFSKAGRGTTVNLSGSGVLFETEQPLAAGRAIQFSIEWPVMLEGRVRLSLVGRGRIVRTTGNTAAVQFSHYQFRTRSSAGQSTGRKAAGFQGTSIPVEL